MSGLELSGTGAWDWELGGELRCGCRFGVRLRFCQEAWFT